MVFYGMPGKKNAAGMYYLLMLSPIKQKSSIAFVTSFYQG